MDTFAFGYILPTTWRIRDLTRWKRAPPGARIKNKLWLFKMKSSELIFIHRKITF
jgi:hypothetical protein